jgi:hypothetical protein
MTASTHEPTGLGLPEALRIYATVPVSSGQDLLATRCQAFEVVRQAGLDICRAWVGREEFATWQGRLDTWLARIWEKGIGQPDNLPATDEKVRRYLKVALKRQRYEEDKPQGAHREVPLSHTDRMDDDGPWEQVVAGPADDDPAEVLALDEYTRRVEFLRKQWAEAVDAAASFARTSLGPEVGDIYSEAIR